MTWPQHGCLLIPGVNDTWNEFQKSCSGVVSSIDWKKAREKLQSEYEDFLSKGGIPTRVAEDSCRQRDNSCLMLIVIKLIFLEQEGGNSLAQAGCGNI